MWPIETCRLILSHGGKIGTLLASSASSSATALTAALISAAPVVRLGAASTLLVRAPAISLVLGRDRMKRLLHGECNLLYGMDLCN